MICSKLSIGCFLLRIAVRRVHTWIIYMAMFISVVTAVVFFFVTLFQCHPVYHFWTKYGDDSGSCISMDVIIALGYLYSILNIISDLTLTLLPMVLVMNLQLGRRTKLALIPLFAMGCVASAAVIARIPYLPSFRSTDFLWSTSDIAIWSTVEQGLAITAGNIATLRPLFALFFGRGGVSKYTSRQHTSMYSGPGSSVSHAWSGGARKGQIDSNAYDTTEVDMGPFPYPPNGSARALVPPQTLHGRAKSSSDSSAIQATDHQSTQSLQALESVSDEGMRIMVSRSFLVTDTERSSYIEKTQV